MSHISGRAEPPEPERVRVVALGDLILLGEWEVAAREAPDPFGALRQLVGDDLVFANLETTVCGTEEPIAKEPRIIASAETVRETLEALNVQVVSLANNHSFDAKRSGFESTCALLDGLGVRYFGAGTNAAAAARHLIVVKHGVRIGWLGYVARDTRPSHVASAGGCGVNPLAEEAVIADVEKLRGDVDHVVVSFHWGVEYCDLPSPEQVRLGRAVIDAGASLVLGHHAHVMQGVERYGRGLIAYNLGNATTTDFFVGGQRAIRQSRRTRSGLMLRVELTTKAVCGVEEIPIRTRSGVLLVEDEIARSYLNRANRRLAQGVTPGRWKRVRLLGDVGLRTLRKLHPSVVRSVRFRHVGTALRDLLQAVRGKGPA